MSGAQKLAVTVTDIVPVTDLVTRFVFKRTDGGLLPTFSGGAHTVVEMRGDNTVRMNPYSLMSDPMDQSAYTISVRRDNDGRGGSVFMHTCVNIGDQMVISHPVNLFSLDLRAKKQLFIAGGIGITPFLAQIKQSERLGGRWELHYASKSKALAAYGDDLLAKHPSDVNVYYSDQGQRIDTARLLDGQPIGTHVYVCGPKSLIDHVRTTAAAHGWPRENIHYEEFLAPQPGKPFEVKLAISNKVVHVGEQESLLEAMERSGVDAPYLCRGGACGQCETQVIDYTGNFIHRDHWLDDAEHASGAKIMPCVSRFEGKTLVLDR
jgi:ferredoxin-NADP reductase